MSVDMIEMLSQCICKEQPDHMPRIHCDLLNYCPYWTVSRQRGHDHLVAAIIMSKIFLLFLLL